MHHLLKERRGSVKQTQLLVELGNKRRCSYVNASINVLVNNFIYVHVRSCEYTCVVQCICISMNAHVCPYTYAYHALLYRTIRL